jgi:XTP/dITP diphosphohydrolase
MITILIATRNAHKVEEIRAVLGQAFRYLTLADFPAAPAVIEDANTFAGNATKKAAELAVWCVSIVRQLPAASRGSAPDFVLADDSGLEVDALQGAPGVYSARFAALDGRPGGNSSDAANNAKLLRLLTEVPMEHRTARFRCVIALTPVPALKSTSPVVTAADLMAQTRLFEGACEGRMGLAPQGQGGFGYDPLFIPRSYADTFAELGESIKNRISHRARALSRLKEHLAEQGAG